MFFRKYSVIEPLGVLQFPTIVQQVRVTKNLSNPPAAPTYTTRALTLEFSELLLRQPVPPQGDVIFTAGDLEIWAGMLWSVMN
ncbi:hypothetical protein V8E54_014361 [Elaphomyces granulatus]|jgi:hypothetical protein